MAVTMLDIHLKNTIEYAIKLVRSNPDKYLKDIFGDYNLDPHAALYGNRLIALVKNWIIKTDIPVVLGFDLSAVKLPCITVHLASTSPSQTFMGDQGGWSGEDILTQERDVIVPAFQPLNMVSAADGLSLILNLNPAMPFEQRELIIPGLSLRDAKKREYAISMNDNGDILVLQLTDSAPLKEIDMTSLEVISPISMARIDRGVMLMDEVATVAVHGHTDRNEGLWLYYITMWGLLKMRPLMISVYGLDLAVPVASDFSKDDSTLGTNSWRRFIQLSAKSVWSWEGPRQGDAVGLLLSMTAGRAGNNGP